MGRPRIKNKKIAVNLYLHPVLKAEVKEYVYHNEKSLSDMVERLLKAEIASKTGLLTEDLLAHQKALKVSASDAEDAVISAENVRRARRRAKKIS